jgi:hypothetical protein
MKLRGFSKNINYKFTLYCSNSLKIPDPDVGTLIKQDNYLFPVFQVRRFPSALWMELSISIPKDFSFVL